MTASNLMKLFMFVLVIFVLNIIHSNVLPVSGNPKPRKSATELFSSDSYNFQMTRRLCRLLLASVSGGVPVLMQLAKCNNSLSVC